MVRVSTTFVAGTRYSPILINIPFIGHIFVFSILAASATTGKLILSYSSAVLVVGLVLTWFALNNLRKANGRETQEIRGLMLFSLGWQLVAVFGGQLIITISGMNLSEAVMANSSAISHFGLFATIQGCMFGEQAVLMIAFVFAMPFLVHPLVFGIFGKTAENNGIMPVRIVYFLTLLGAAGVLYAMIG
ncbi:MAG TPA: hypothetical protein ENN08_01990 [Bacteroidales bacterium]|nr:hypothetical protein [Bacteroidales bacterium]